MPNVLTLAFKVSLFAKFSRAGEFCIFKRDGATRDLPEKFAAAEKEPRFLEALSKASDSLVERSVVVVFVLGPIFPKFFNLSIVIQH